MDYHVREIVQDVAAAEPAAVAAPARVNLHKNVRLRATAGVIVHQMHFGRAMQV